jgi:hydroxyethylthiazole kinase-like uncharacterized protein yjeF
MQNKILSGTQIKILDKLAIEKYGIPSIVLMENAGGAIAAQVRTLLKNKRNPTVSIVCGLGNNGGDGLVAGRHLLNAGITTHIFILGNPKFFKQDTRTNYSILKKIGYTIQDTPILNTILLKHIVKSDIVIDAIFGVGLNRAITEPCKSYIEGINQKAKFILAVDIPSGLDATTGDIYGACIKAHMTVTFTSAKRGLYKSKGPKHVGKVVVTDIGIPLKLKNRI